MLLIVTAITLLAFVVGVIILTVVRHGVDADDLGSVSEHWLAEHCADSL